MSLSRHAEEDDAGSAAAVPGAQLVVKALNLLDLIGHSPGRHRAQSVARELGLPRSTVYRILTVLQQRGMVRHDPEGGGLHPGFRFLEYAQGVWPMGDLPLLAMVETRALGELTGETVFFAVRAGDGMTIVQRTEGSFPVRAAAMLGGRLPLHCTGPGRAFLASLSPDERDQTIARLPLQALTARTITDGAQLAAQLDLLRLRRYAIDDEEFETGVRCVGAAAIGEDGRPIGAFGVAGPSFRLTHERAHQLGAEVAAAADRLAAGLRRRGARPQASGAVEMIAPASRGRASQGRTPVWDAAEARLLWLDAFAPALMESGESGAPRLVAALDAPAMALASLGAGRWFVATAAGARLVAGGRIAPFWPDAPAALLAHARDARADREGAVWLATAASPGGEARHGLYRIADGSAALAIELDAAPAGFAFSERRGELFVASAETGDILKAPFPQRGDLKPVLRIDPIYGRPSALAMDAAGDLWVALRDGWAVARVAPDGGDLRLIQLAAPRPSGLCFGGANGDTLFVLSSRVDLSPQQILDAPASGAVFAIDRERRERLLR